MFKPKCAGPGPGVSCFLSFVFVWKHSSHLLSTTTLKSSIKTWILDKKLDEKIFDIQNCTVIKTRGGAKLPYSEARESNRCKGFCVTEKDAKIGMIQRTQKTATVSIQYSFMRSIPYVHKKKINRYSKLKKKIIIFFYIGLYVFIKFYCFYTFCYDFWTMFD